MVFCRSHLFLPLLLSVGACASSTAAIDTGESHLEGDAAAAAADLRYTDATIAPARMKVRFGDGAVTELKPSAQSQAADGRRTVQLGVQTSLPAIVVNMPADRWTAGALDCAVGNGLIVVGVLEAGHVLRTTYKLADGVPQTRACTLTVEQAIDWDTWKRGWGPTEASLYGTLAPPSGTTRTLVRAHFEADLGPTDGADVTTHVSGAFDFWDNRNAALGF